jgi:hypothetical protein
MNKEQYDLICQLTTEQLLEILQVRYGMQAISRSLDDMNKMFNNDDGMDEQ